MKRIFEHIAKRLCHKKYIQLRDRLLAEYVFVEADEINDYSILSKLLISGEDHRFYYHIGFDFIAIIRAIRNRLFYHKIEGASTIEQQLVRVLTNDFEKSLKRKIQEILLSTAVSSIIPKSAIPKIYLNVAYYGTEMKGLNQTFSKLGIVNRATIQVEQAAEIVSRIKYPQPSNPSQKRLSQIEIRKQHLIKLYNKHRNHKFFKIYG